MTFDSPPSAIAPQLGSSRLAASAHPSRSPGGARLSILATAAFAGLLLALLAGAGRLAPPLAAVCALAVLAVAGVLAWRCTQGVTGTSSPTRAGEPPIASAQEAQTYALALEMAPNPVLVVTGGDIDDIAARRILFANAEAREFLRIGREGALLVAAIRNPGVLEAVDESLFGRISRIVTFETTGRSDRFWRVWTRPLPSTEAHERMALVIMRDETEIRMNERMRADFLANASHELRTPLASLTGFIETLRNHARDDTDARERFLAIMSRQADRMARLIDDLLSLSRIELNEHVRPSGACDLALAAMDVVDALAPQIAFKSVRVTLDLPPRGSAEVVGDRDQIVQVIQNLLDNAVKYSPIAGVVAVSVSAGLSLEEAFDVRPGDPRTSAPDGGRMSLLTPVRTRAERYVRLRVEDRGPGLAREHLPRLSERFYRVEGQRSGERMGTGLGLAIVKHIANRHRGGFFVESAPGHGAAFGVYLPMAAAADDEARASPGETKLS